MAPTDVLVTLDGRDVASSTRWAGCTITDVLNAVPNTASLSFDTRPSVGQAVQIGLGTLAVSDLLFAGTVLEIGESYENQYGNMVWPTTLIDWTFLLNRRRPFGTWTDISATTIAQSIVSTYASGFTSAGVAASLAIVTITFDGSEDFMTCLSRLATAIGGYCYVDYGKDVHLFLTEVTSAPDPVDATHPPFNSPPITFTQDLSQLRTRGYGKGHGEAVPVDVLAAATIVPLDDAVMFNAAGGQAIAGTTPDGAQSQILTYTGTQLGGSGSLVGPGAAPSTAPVLTLAVGAGLSAGVYQYAYTDATPIGESLPSPLGSITVGAVTPPPTVALVASLQTPPSAGFLDAGTHDYVYTWTTALGETTVGPASNTITATPADSLAQCAGVPTWPTGVGITGLKVYRRFNGAGTYKLAKTITNPAITIFGDGLTNAALGAAAPGADTTAQFQVALSGIAIGANTTTSRKVYRTVVSGSTLKLQQTIANNTATVGVQDATADGSLGATAPITNTSGLSAVATAGGTFYTAAPVVFSTNGAATVATSSAPIFTSVSYTFVAADVGAYVYIKSGVNWTAGRYLIASVAAGAATLTGACASVASPTAATWGVDYSGFTTPRVTFTDLVIDAVTSTKFTSAAFPVAVNYIGNVLTVTSGVGFSAQQVVVISVAAAVATCDKVLGALSSTGGAGLLGLAPVDPFVLAGTTTLPTTSAAAFSATGGWVTIGQQFIRYTGLTGNNLTGIPASGSGAITITVPYGTQVLAAPALTGVTGLTLAMQKGTPVHIWVQRDHAAAQTAVAALTGGDGIHEYLMVDERRGEASLTALIDADLATFATPITSVTYACNDPLTRSGKTVAISLAIGTWDVMFDPAVFGDVIWGESGNFTIQEVTITFDAPGQFPRYTVKAASTAFTLADLLRRVPLAA